MDIKLLKTADPPHKLNKTFTEIATITATLKDDTNIMRPIIMLSPSYFSTACNYCYIPDFKRYYYINGKGIAVGKLILLTLEIDVLMSWQESIKASNVIASRSTNKGNKLLPDSIPVLANRNVIYKAFSGGAHDNGAFGSEFCTAEQPHFLLTVLNGEYETAGVTTLELIEVNGANVRIAWDEIPDVATYWIYRKAPGALDFEVIEENPGGTYYTDTVSETGTYQYKVAGVIDGNPGADSNIISAEVAEV